MNQKGSFFRIYSMYQEPSADLYDRIIKRINYEQGLAFIKRKLFWHFIGLLASLILFIPLGYKLFIELNQSGFIQSFSLIFSDFQIVMFNLSDFSLSLLESLPAFSLTLMSIALLAMIFYMSKFVSSLFDFKKFHIN